VQMDDGGDEYGELLGMAEEDEERDTGGPRYEPDEEEERVSRGQERPQPQCTIVQVPQPRPVIVQVPQPGPVITQAPRATGKKQPKVGVSRGKQTDPVLQSRGQQADTPPVAPPPEMIVTVPQGAPAENRRMESRREQGRRRRLDRQARAEEARAARPPPVLSDGDTDMGTDDRRSRTLALPRSGEVQADPPRFTVHAEVHRPEVEWRGVQDEVDHGAVDMQEPAPALVHEPQLALGHDVRDEVDHESIDMQEPAPALAHEPKLAW